MGFFPIDMLFAILITMGPLKVVLVYTDSRHLVSRIGHANDPRGSARIGPLGRIGQTQIRADHPVIKNSSGAAINNINPQAI